MLQKFKHLLMLSALIATQSWAGTTIIDFNEDPSISGTSTNFGSATWFPSGGVGWETNGLDGYLQMTGTTSQKGAVVFPDFDNGAVVQGFTFECDLRIGNGNPDPADGFSINYARNGDPALVAGDGFASSPGCEGNLPEEGTTTGISIGFDAWQSGDGVGCSTIGPDVIGLSVRIDGTLVSQFPCPTKNGTCADATSLQTGPRDESGTADGLCWARLKVELSPSGVLNVYWKGQRILADFVATGYYPSPGRLVFAGRTGGNWQFQQVDNIKITTIPASLALLSPATGLPDGFSITVTDAGTTSVLNPNSVTALLNGAPVAPLTITKAGSVSTITFHSFPTLLTPGFTNTLVLTAKDTNNNDVGGTREFIAAAYATIPVGDAVTGVDTTKVGFRIMPWQSGNQPNRTYWTEEQLIGLHGANNADLSLATDGGYIPYTGVINFNGNTDQQGSFQLGAGYPDGVLPGIPGPNGLYGNSSLEALMFMKFSAAGLYTLVVNSDDGFLVTEGKNPKDRFANRLGVADMGKGASDVTFSVAVMAPGTYPVRLIWENGNGELPGNGLNVEFFSIANGIKTLINDPSPTNTSGIVAYYAGPALPAYVSHLYPFAGATGARADKLVAQVTDGGTTLTGGSAKLYLDGVLVNSTVAKVGAVSTVQAVFTPATMMAPGTRTAALVWSDSGGTVRSNSWQFGVGNWVTLNAGLSAPLNTADATKPGFMLQVAQIDPDIMRPGAGDSMANQVDSVNALLGNCYFPWYATNTVETNYFPMPLHDNVWVWDSAVDFNIVTSLGDFPINQLMPGIPGTSFRSDNFGAWFNGYVAFTNAGYYRMQISSDDGFRLSQGLGITRQVLHLKGSGVDRDVAAVVTTTNNSNFGGSLPVVPISGPVAYFSATTPTVGTTVDLTGKIAAMNNTEFADRAYVQWAQDMGAIGAVLINDQTFGLPYLLGGSSVTKPIHIPVLCVNGFGGEEAMWATNANLVATIGADAQQQLGIADYGKGMSWIDCSVVVPQPGLYPLHLTYWQGGGGAGLEWATAYSDTLAWDDVRRVLVQDTATAGALNGYRALTVQPTPTIKVVKQGAGWTIQFTGTLLSSQTANGTYAPVAGATSPYTVPTGSGAAKFYRSAW